MQTTPSKTLTQLLNIPQEDLCLQSLIEILKPLKKYPYCGVLYMKAAQNAKIIGRYDWKDFAAKAVVYSGNPKHVQQLMDAIPYKTNLAVPPIKVKVQASSLPSSPQQPSKEQLIDRFLTIEHPEIPIVSTEQNNKKSENEIEDETIAFATETMAKILEQQGKYKEAIKIYRRLAWDNPQKSITFAARIKELETLTEK